MSKLNLNVAFALIEESSFSEEDFTCPLDRIRSLDLNIEEEYEECEVVRIQYERMISRTSTYKCRDLACHIGYGWGQVYKYLTSYLVGSMYEGVFVLSHFAPRTLREGMSMMKFVAYHETIPMVLAVPHRQAKMAIRCGWDLVGFTWQKFGEEWVKKVVLCNRALSNDKYWFLYEKLQFEAALRKPHLP